MLNNIKDGDKKYLVLLTNLWMVGSVHCYLCPVGSMTRSDFEKKVWDHYYWFSYYLQSADEIKVWSLTDIKHYIEHEYDIDYYYLWSDMEQKFEKIYVDV